ncbi:hypothetical protein [Uliginosibacterium sp. H1]|uniref:hypothetical protein n=1 Tax=Uliginosibacterium sp. H1 TaxID=3114757 RepID=UPI002E179952|nr:hypothetical protein [Uliginosibacterium sp. H1]
MSTSSVLRSPKADPLYAQPPADRPAYATGMLLDAQDFLDEQTYHRGRLARALMLLAGGGTLAGLRVSYQAAVEADEETDTPAVPEEIRVEPGLAVDRLGRLIELQRPACLRLARWWDATEEDSLRVAAYTGFTDLLSARVQQGVTLPTRAVAADIYLRFTACPRGLTPAFASGPFDALNAVSTSRVRDGYELTMVPRAGLAAGTPGLPLPAGGSDIGSADADVRRAALQDAVFDGYPATDEGDGSGNLPGLSEHPTDVGIDTTSVFIARVLIPVSGGDGDPAERDGDAVLVDNYSRRLLPGVALLSRLAGY